ncbi:FKBP-type peptidyl-prolyl cis-trans isomerase [Nocardioides sp. W7]|uniref:FKBP-type peptidyl-prolyl cis-trans isomerase n=1 Tax=Nocardioides sp. W7 TaxID=2931390 RepID=UPI001FD4C53B|nr:FKBP-type peptidyl-prolyl cis-trans isomerase [Nocardioides sp. W7]
MLPRLHRPLAALLPVLFLGLAACGGDDGARPTDIEGPQGFDAVEIAGDQGVQPEVTWKGQMEAGKLEVKTLVEGEGDPVAKGDSVSTNLWIGNGFSKTEAYTTYGDEGGGAQPIAVDEEELAPIFVKALEGQTKGSRVAVVGSATEAFGENGQPALGIGDGDTVLLIADLMADPKPVKPKRVPASQLPKVVEKGGVVKRLSFQGLKEPAADGDLLRSVVKRGTGAVVTEDMTVTANYLGHVYGAKKPFDESFSKEPVPFSLQEVVKGWTYGLSGVKVGSRVLLQIPPELGYGAQEKENIPANSTLYFVVDIISAE